MDNWNKIIRSPLVLAIAIVVISQLAALLFRVETGKSANKLLAPLDTVNKLQTDLSCSDFNITPVEAASFVRLNKIILKQKEQHKLTFIKLYRYYLASISLLTIFSILSGILGFIIAQKGWKNTDIRIRSVFLTSVALTSFYGLSISVFKQETGINQNIKSYIKYDNIQKEILNYCSTKPNRTISGDTINVGEFQTYVVRKMIETNNVYLEFDKDAIEIKDYLNHQFN